MSKVLSIGTSNPPFCISQEKTQELAKEIFKDSFPDIDRLLRAFSNGQIRKRYFCVPMEWFKQEKSFEEKNRLFEQFAVELGLKAIDMCLNNDHFLKKSIPFNEIDAIIFVTSSGISTPSIEARIMNQRPFSSQTKRIPLWGLGCGGGAGGLARAHDYCLAHPKSKVLVLSVELCSLTFQVKDKSKSNLIGTSLFADGVACVLVAGDQVDEEISNLCPIPYIKEVQSTLMPNSEDVMGWKVRSNGLYVVFSRSIPKIVKEWLAPIGEAFLRKNHLHFEDIKHFITHPGGKKVLDSYQDCFNIAADKLQKPWTILQNYGNMSSATVLFVLNEFLNEKLIKGDLGLMVALGPGFSAEFVLLEWR